MFSKRDFVLGFWEVGVPVLAADLTFCLLGNPQPLKNDQRKGAERA